MFEKHRAFLLSGIFPALFLIFLLFPAQQSFADIIATGTARIFGKDKNVARTQAIKNAQRNAIEQGLGVYVDSTAIVENWRIIQDKIFRSSKGYVTDYDIIEDRETDDGQSWYVKIDAVISSSLKDDLRALNILHQKAGNLVYAVSLARNANALSLDPELVKTAAIKITDEFKKLGFRLRAIPEKEKFQDVGLKQKFSILSALNVRMLIEYDLNRLGAATTGNKLFKTITYNVTIKVYDVSTGEIISEKQSAQRYFTKPSSLNGQRKLEESRAVAQSAAVAANAAKSDIIKNYQETDDSGSNYVIIFQNYSNENEQLFVEILTGMAGYESHREIKKIRGLLSLDYTSRLSLGEIRKRLESEASGSGVKLSVKVSFGNRLVFVRN